MNQFAIIGCGHIAHRHAVQIGKHGKLAAVCDVISEKADAFAAEYGARAYYSIDDLLKKEPDVNIVAVCSPNGLHAEHAIKSLQGGRHVLCEKPMCITSAAAWQMNDTAHFFRRKLFVVKQNRFNPPVVAVKKLIDEGKLGKIYGFQINGFWNRPETYYQNSWKGTRYLDGGIVYTQFSHFIDLLYWFLGDLAKVQCISKKFHTDSAREIEDTVTAIAEMQSGAIGTMHFSVNSFEKNREGSFTLIAENGIVKIGGEYLNTLEWHFVKGVPPPLLQESATANSYGSYTGSMSNHHLVYGHLVQALDNPVAAMPEGIDAVKTVEMIERIYNSAAR
jgi:UDP-N-acetyl-2-amino-2-deoxyglucuronate dehydrogenase